ncbi:hypothetical protein H8D64_00010, partial [PVC group bacterium]|nr:hypothetical protein [PVC group bacterium]
MLNEISERITTINRRQIESNVFSEKEIADLSDTGNTVSGVKTQQMKRIITELGKSIQTDSTQTVQTHRKNARNEYKEAVSILNNLTFLASEKELRLRMSTRTLIEDQRQLLNETRKLQKEQEAKNSLDENDIEQSWDMAERQRALRADAP